MHCKPFKGFVAVAYMYYIFIRGRDTDSMRISPLPTGCDACKGLGFRV